MAKTKAQIQKEFDDFAEKIAQLEGLRHELDALDTKGLESEAKLIRAKLKDVRAIGSIKRDIGILRKKIEKRHAAGASVANVRRRIAELEKIIEGKKKLAEKSQFSKEEIADVKDIPKLESELRKLRIAFEEHTKGGKVKVDSGVGVIVDSRFDDFMGALKSDLTEKLRAEEVKLRTREEIELKADLNERKEAFAEKAAKLEETESKELMKKEDALKKKAEAFAEKAAKLEETESKELMKKEDALKKKAEALEKKGLELVKKAHEDYEKRVKRDLEREVKSKFDAEVKGRVNAIKDKVINETKRKVLSNMMKINAQRIGEAVKMQKSKMGSEMKMTIDSIKTRMHNQMIKEAKAEVKKREAEIRRKLEKEYNDKIRREMEMKNAEIQKKKAQLEAFVAEQAKRIFK